MKRNESRQSKGGNRKTYVTTGFSSTNFGWIDVAHSWYVICRFTHVSIMTQVPKILVEKNKPISYYKIYGYKRSG